MNDLLNILGERGQNEGIKQLLLMSLIIYFITK